MIAQSAPQLHDQPTTICCSLRLALLCPLSCLQPKASKIPCDRNDWPTVAQLFAGSLRQPLTATPSSGEPCYLSTRPTPSSSFPWSLVVFGLRSCPESLVDLLQSLRICPWPSVIPLFKLIIFITAIIITNIDTTTSVKQSFLLPSIRRYCSSFVVSFRINRRNGCRSFVPHIGSAAFLRGPSSAPTRTVQRLGGCPQGCPRSLFGP